MGLNMFKIKSKLFHSGLAIAVVLTSGMVNNAFAQDGAFAIEEITVTARKKEESLLETPLAITAIDAAQIQASAFKNILDVQKTAPGLFIESMNNENGRVIVMPRFRGVTFDATSPTILILSPGFTLIFADNSEFEVVESVVVS